VYKYAQQSSKNNPKEKKQNNKNQLIYRNIKAPQKQYTRSLKVCNTYRKYARFLLLEEYCRVIPK